MHVNISLEDFIRMKPNNRFNKDVIYLNWLTAKADSVIKLRNMVSVNPERK